MFLCNQNSSCMTITGDIMNNEFNNDIYPNILSVRVFVQYLLLSSPH
jgi:hypothetical protein